MRVQLWSFMSLMMSYLRQVAITAETAKKATGALAKKAEESAKDVQVRPPGKALVWHAACSFSEAQPFRTRCCSCFRSATNMKSRQG